VARRVSPTERIRARIHELFASDRTLTEVLEEVKRFAPRQGRAPGGAPGRNRTKGTKATERVRARGSHVRTGSLTQSAWGGGAEHSKNPDAASPAIGVDAWQWETGAAPPGSAASRTVTRATSAPAASSSACNSSKPTTTSTTPSTPPTGLSTAATLTATSCL